MPSAENGKLAMPTRADRRVLELIGSDLELRRSILDAPDSSNRERALADRLKLPWGNRGKLNRARLFFGDHLDSLVDFGGIPRLYFRALESAESIADLQRAVSRYLNGAESTYLNEMEELRARTALALSDTEAMEQSLSESDPEERAARMKELRAIHRATLALFEDQLAAEPSKFVDATAISVLLGPKRVAADREIAELKLAAFAAIKGTTQGRMLRDMVLTNGNIRRVHQGEENRATTTTNYSVPAANYWRWGFGSGKPVRVPTLSPDDAQSARSIWQQHGHPGLQCPWVELEGLPAA